jgi:hypothetical protein
MAEGRAPQGALKRRVVRQVKEQLQDSRQLADWPKPYYKRCRLAEHVHSSVQKQLQYQVVPIQ